LFRSLVVVARRLHLLEQPEVPVVFEVRRPLAGIGDDRVVLALILRHVARDYVGVGAIPARRVVHAGLPAVVERDAAAGFRVAGLGQPTVPADEVGPAAIEEGLGDGTCGPAARAGLVEDAL